jgi:hypothetical protein
MEICEVRTKKEKRSFIRFVYDLYKDDPNFCDLNLTFVKIFLYKQDGFARRCKVLPIQMKEKGEIKLECMYVMDETKEIKLSFLEFVPHAREYLEALLEYTKELMRKHQKEKTIVGVNGQISYGLGILTDAYNRKFEFNANYHKEYYAKELDEAFPVMKRAFSYQYDAKHSLAQLDQAMLKQVREKYRFRYLNLWRFKRDMLLFGELCHASLKSTPYYAEKKPYEMYELMNKMRFLMRKEDLIFAMKDGKEIGFIYTHPDYAELFGKPRLNYVTFFLRFLKKHPKNVIYNVIGVLPEHQASGVAVALIERSIQIRKKDYPQGVSSFILEDNLPSTKLCGKLSTGINKEFHLYEISMEIGVEN